MKTLLAIINQPKESKEFIQYVAGMATDFRANVHLMFVQNPNNYALGTMSSTGAPIEQLGTLGYPGTEVIEVQKNVEKLAHEAEETLTKYIKDVKSKMTKKVVIDFSAELGVSSVIAEKLVSENKIDMVVLEGQKNKNFWAQTSDNMEIIKSIECPVWIIPNALDYKPFSDITYATDYKEEDINSLKSLISLAEHFSYTITALHVTDSVDFKEKVKKEGFQEMLQKKLVYGNLKVEVIDENSKNLAEDINDYAMQNESDLVVILKENKSFLERIFTSDSTKTLLKKSKLPILVLHEKE